MSLQLLMKFIFISRDTHGSEKNSNFDVPFHSVIEVFLGNKHTHFTCMYLISKKSFVYKKRGKFEDTQTSVCDNNTNTINE